MNTKTRAALVAVIGLLASPLMAPAGAAPSSAVALEAAPGSTISGRITTADFDLESFAMKSPIEVHAFAKVGDTWEMVGYARTKTAYSPAQGIELDGTFVVSVRDPYPVVRLMFAQKRCLDYWDACFQEAPDVLTTHWNGTLLGSPTLEDAHDMALGSGPVTDVDVTLRRAPKLRPATQPRITGDPAPGQVLTAQPGSFTPTATTATYRWVAAPSDADGTEEYEKLVGTGRTFRVPSSLLGDLIQVEVLPARVGFEAPIVGSSHLAVKSRSRVAAKAKPGQRKATVTIAIKAPGVATSRIHGKASIYAKGQRIKTVSVKNGKATVAVTKQRKGKRTYTVRYSGNRVVSSSSTSLKIAIR
ncbi:hypothetical protein [Aeromicrobium choanae]|uniref:Ig-like domain (Group 3) n=1 Tax=Aeromicrobium choanae TaxID=1736691 RepID=A0A1T4Z329_9ACTN|nr:hypothetical protein [Aeromicrobium choanae]SKB08273.1 hypothetical protein SAMN06295964_2073 [Aeromicrobium choanae]